MQRYLRVFQYFAPVESRPYRHRQNQFGQGMTEYIIIVAIIAIGAVTASSFFGARVQTQFVAMGNEISGEAGEPVGPVAAPTPARATLGTYVNN